MPWAWAMLHMIAGVTAPPRWQWSSASGILRESWRAIALRIRVRTASGRPGVRRPLFAADEQRQLQLRVRRGRQQPDLAPVRDLEAVAEVGDLAADGFEVRLAEVCPAAVEALIARQQGGPVAGDGCTGAAP